MNLKRGEFQNNYSILFCLLKKKRKYFFSDKLLPKNYFAGWSKKKHSFKELVGRCVALKKRMESRNLEVVL